MTTSAPLPKGHPLLAAWNAYRETEEAKNSELWAARFDLKSEPDEGRILIQHPHLEGALWAAFAAGFEAARSNP
jgi:hypothetical protein